MRLDQILAELGENEKQRVLRLLQLPGTNTEVARILTRNGHPIGEASIRRWKAKRA